MANKAQATDDRLVAARLMHRLLVHRQTLDQLEPDAGLEPFVRELVYGTARHYFSLAYRLHSVLDRTLRTKDQDLFALMLIGAYQLLHTRVPAHAAVAATVDSVKGLKKPWARGLINASLRSVQRAAEQPLAELTLKAAAEPALSEAEVELPQWLNDELAKDHPEDWPALAHALAARAPMTLRVRLDAAGTLASQLVALNRQHTEPFDRETWILDASIPTRSLPGYAQGSVSVQDAGAQLALHALEQLRSHLLPMIESISAAPDPGKTEDPKPTLRFLDACTAPGGKLFHLLERWQPDFQLEVLAMDASADRLAFVAAEAKRLRWVHPAADANLRLKFLEADATDRGWWDGQTFDLVLVDAPCSGTGTLRRHPDVKLLRQAEDIDQQCLLQTQLLANLAHCVRPGGGMLYATCSLLARENDQVVGHFLAAHPGWRLVPLTLPSGSATNFGWQLLPTDPRTDGFYYAALVQLQ